MLQTWLLAASIAAGGVLIFALDCYIRRHGRTPINHFVFFAMVGGAYYFGLEGLGGAVAIGMLLNGAHVVAVRNRGAATTVP